MLIVAAAQHHHAGGPHRADDDAGERQQHAALGPELEDEHDDDEARATAARSVARSCSMRLRAVDLERLHAGDREACRRRPPRRPRARTWPSRSRAMNSSSLKRFEQHENAVACRRRRPDCRRRAGPASIFALNAAASAVGARQLASAGGPTRTPTRRSADALDGGQADHLAHAVERRRSAATAGRWSRACSALNTSPNTPTTEASSLPKTALTVS